MKIQTRDNLIISACGILILIGIYVETYRWFHA